MTELPAATVRRTGRFSFAWIVPLLCLGMVSYFTVHHLRTRGPEIEIRFPDADTLLAGKTLITYRGVVVGRVTDVDIGENGEDVLVKARLVKSAADLAREGTVFITVKPEVSIAGVQGLSAIFRGSTLALKPGKGDPATSFKGYVDQRAYERVQPGLDLRLVAPKAGSLQAGDGVFFRGVRVGSVMDTDFTKTAQAVVVHIKIREEHVNLVRTNTEFWDASGLKAKIGLFGAKISVDSLQTLMSGGIAFATPEPPGPPAKDDAEFTLNPQSKPEWENAAPRL
jgi:paraquat-inducible protein B